MATKVYENFPIRIVIVCNLVPVLIYAVGAYILTGFGLWVSILYLLYCFWIEVRVLRIGCVNCYYYGKVCGSGKGKLCSWLFKPGDPQKFAQTEISWLEMVPDFLVSILPLVGGVVLLIVDFNWLLVAMLVVLLLLALKGNAVIRTSFMCKYCRQREIGCPAEKLFRRETV